MWLYIYKECVQGAVNKLKSLRYRPFDIDEQGIENAFKLSLAPDMQICSVVNVEYMKLFNPYMMHGEEHHQVLPIVEEFSPHVLEGLDKHTILQEGANNSQRMGRDLANWSQQTNSKERKMI